MALTIGVPHTKSQNRIYLTKLDGVALSAGRETVPYAPTVPESIRQLNEPLFGFLEDQTRILRKQHLMMIHGQTTLNFDALFAVYDRAQFDLGVLGRFNHPLYGLIIARFVRFTRMSGLQSGGPVGFNSDTNHLDWSVTNDFDKSNSFYAIGLIATSKPMVNGQFGWVIVQGANIQPVMLRGGETATQGKELSWSGTNEISVTQDGVTLGFYAAFIDVDSVTGFKAGDLLIQMGSNTNRQTVAVQKIRIDGVDVRIDGVDATVSTLSVVVADNDEAIATQIGTLETNVGDNTSQLVNERLARVEGDSILAISVDSLTTQLGTDVIALNSTIKTVEAGISAARASEILQLRAELQSNISDNQLLVAQAETQISTLVTQQGAQTSLISGVAAGVDSPASNLLGTDAGPEQSSVYLYLDKELIANLNIEIGESISIIGELDPQGTAVNFRIHFEFWTIGDVSLGIHDTNVLTGSGFQNAIADAIEIPLTTAKISVSLLRAGGSGGVGKRVMLVRGETHRQFAGSVNVSAFTTLEARVIVNEGDIVTAFARWAVTIDVDGHVAGLELIGGTGTKSTFTAKVDKFIITDAVTSETPFEIDGGVVKLKELVVSQLIRSDNWNASTKLGFELDRTSGTFRGQGIEIFDINGNLTFSSGTLLEPYFPKLAWFFENTADTWTHLGITQTLNPAYMTLDAITADPNSRIPNNLTLVGATAFLVRAKIRRTAGSAWQGACFYRTSGGHGESGSFMKVISDPTTLNQWVIAEWDMSALTAGGTDWIDSIITAIRLDFGTAIGDKFDIEWISIGNISPANRITAANATTFIADAAIGTLQIGTLNASVITAGTITASRFLTDSGVDLASIVPGSLSFGIDETDATVRTIVNFVDSETFSDWTTIFVKSGHRIIINIAEVIVARANVPATLVPLSGQKLYRRVDGGAPVEIAALAIVQVTTQINRVIVTNLVDSPGDGNIEYRIGVTKTWSGGHDNLKFWDSHIDVEVLFSK